MRFEDQESHSQPSFFTHFVNIWKKLPEGFRWNLEGTFQPESIEERLLPGEEPLLIVRIAWYRNIIARFVFRYLIALMVLTVFASILIYLRVYTDPYLDWYWATLPIFVFLILLVTAIMQRIHYLQWRILKTNARLIISIPQPGTAFLIDNIELKGLPAVLDPNWSRNPVWRIFQFFTGARDMYISLSAYKFVEGTARVGDALIIPDVMPDEFFELKRLIFMP